MRTIESEKDAEALGRACGQARAVVVPKHSWLERLTNSHDFNHYPQPAKKTLLNRLGPLVKWEEQRTLDKIPTPESPYVNTTMIKNHMHILIRKAIYFRQDTSCSS